MDDAAVVEVQGGLQQQVREYCKNGGMERNLHHKKAELLYLLSQHEDEKQVLDHRLSLCSSLNIINLSDLK